MKIAICTQGISKCVLDHAEGNSIGLMPDSEGIFVDDVYTDLSQTQLPVVNTCVGVQTLLLDPESRGKVYELIGIQPTPAATTLYAIFNGEKFSDWMEVAFSNRFMTGEVGPDVGFATGVGFMCPSTIHEAVPMLGKLQEFLTGIHYHGEVMCNLASNYTLTGLNFGHFYGHFGMFSEICKTNTQSILEFMFGKIKVCELYNNCVVGNIVTRPPFPNFLPAIPSNAGIYAPKGAEKHLWRVLTRAGEMVVITVHGITVYEARKRLRRTIENMISYAKDLQYRIDYGLHVRFVVCQELYEEALARREFPTKVSTPPSVA